ncbi:MAG: malonyl-ACP O-methyltransferase BioC [Legionellaceae bacterium]|nr:malonyl-ACP O-methyltransferase BioC [Legionellaceae bacterium]
MSFSEEICNAFHQRASDYEAAAVAQRAIGTQLFERLSYLKIEPRYVLDLGCGTGLLTKQLKKYYPKAIVVGVDIAHAMLREAQSNQSWRAHPEWLRANMQNLPFANGLFDLVFSNQVFHWSSDYPALIREVNRVMNPGGCLMFSTLGPDTFKELRSSGEPYAHANDFLDMHDVGDILLAEQFLDPVVDMEQLVLRYKTWPDLLRSLKKQGVRNINAKRNQGLTGKKQWAAFKAMAETTRTPEGKYPLTYEVLYGHAWKGKPRQITQGTETSIPVSVLRNSRAP